MNSNDATVVVVAWKDRAELDQCLAGLAAQTASDFSVIVADNGAGLANRLDPWEDRMNLEHLDLGGNRGPSAARNAAAAVATTRMLMFLDDDAVPEPDWVEQLAASFQAPHVVAVRGRVEPKRRPFLTQLARAYSMGDAVCPAILNTEGNCAVLAEALSAVGGFNEDMYGHEGAELSTRLTAVYGADAIIYTPAAVIRHDYVDSASGYIAKRFRHGKMLTNFSAATLRASAGRSRKSFDLNWQKLALLPVKLLGLIAETAGLFVALLTKRTTRRS